MRTETIAIGAMLVMAGVYVGPGRPTDTATISGDSEALALGMEWATKVAPKPGYVSQMVFTSQTAGLNGSGSTARVIVEIHASGTDLCYIDVPCTLTAGTNVTAESNGACNLASFAANDVLHVEWTTSGCLLIPALTNPRGNASANLVMQ